MTKILFVHGLASSGAYKTADMLRRLMRAEVIAPDLPIEPADALELLGGICLDEHPDMAVGLSWGGFLTLRLPDVAKVVINPDLRISRLLRSMTGTQEYLSPRRDGATTFEITEEVCKTYEAMERSFTPLPGPVLGCFADNDRLVNCSQEFESLFPGMAFHYPGGHLPTYPEMKYNIIPEILRFTPLRGTRP